MRFRARCVDEEAMRWVVRMHSDQVTRADESAFTAWLANDRTHSAAYDKLQCLWTDVAALREDQSALTALGPLRRAHAMLARRRFLGFASASLAGGIMAGASGWALWRVLDADTFETTANEQRRVVLPDGSAVTLNADTALRIHFDDGQRRLWLDHGQAFFDVAGNATPFRVFAGVDEVRAVGAAFDVRRCGRCARVTTEKGVVAVFRNADPAQRIRVQDRPAVVLTPSEQVIVSPAKPIRVAHVDTRQAIAWRYGSPETRLQN